jgi:hypothetical protein
MPVTGDTGNGATLTLAIFNGTTAITAALDVISVTPGAITAPGINASTLATSGTHEMIPNDLASVAESTATFKWLTQGAKPTLPSPAGTITLTFPLRTNGTVAETTAATITGTGFITGITPPTMSNGELQVGTIAWQWDGDTGPSLTASAP